MGWADSAIVLLCNGKIAKIKPRGNSMLPLIYSGDEVTIEPLRTNEELSVGDIVLCKVKGNQYLHLIRAIDGKRFLIENNKGRINGWTRTIYGKVTHIKH